MSRVRADRMVRTICRLAVALVSIVSVSAQSGAKNGEWRTWAGDLGSHPLRAARPDQRRQLQLARGGVAIQDRVARHASRLQPPDHAADDQRRALLHGRRAPRRGGASTRRPARCCGCTGSTKARAESPRVALRTRRRLLDRRSRRRADLLRDASAISSSGSNAKTGQPAQRLRQERRRRSASENDDQVMDLMTADVGWNGAPVVAKNVVIIGAVAQRGIAPRPRRMRRVTSAASTSRTGKRLWIFHTIPQPGEFGNDTWVNDSWSYTGNTGVWAPDHRRRRARHRLPAGRDADRRLLRRPSARQQSVRARAWWRSNLETGKRIWHYQFVHHGIWDYDIPCAPILADITVDGQADQGGRRSRPSRAFSSSSIAQTGAAGVADRGAAGRARRRCRANGLADAAVPDQAAALRTAGLSARRPDRLHAGAQGRGAEGRRRSTRSARSSRRRSSRGEDGKIGDALRAERRQLAGRLARSRDRTCSTCISHTLTARAVDGQRSEAIGHELHRASAAATTAAAPD